MKSDPVFMSYECVFHCKLYFSCNSIHDRRVTMLSYINSKSAVITRHSLGETSKFSPSNHKLFTKAHTTIWRFSHPVGDLCRSFTKRTLPSAYTLHPNLIPPTDGTNGFLWLVANISQTGYQCFTSMFLSSCCGELWRLPLCNRPIKGRRQNSSVASGDFLQRMTNVGWWGFAAQLHPYHMLGLRPARVMISSCFFLYIWMSFCKL